MVSNFAAFLPTDPKFLALKDLNPFKFVSKVQNASIILRVGFDLPKWPHFNSIYLVLTSSPPVPNYKIIGYPLWLAPFRMTLFKFLLLL